MLKVYPEPDGMHLRVVWEVPGQQHVEVLLSGDTDFLQATLLCPPGAEIDEGGKVNANGATMWSFAIVHTEPPPQKPDGVDVVVQEARGGGGGTATPGEGGTDDASTNTAPAADHAAE